MIAIEHAPRSAKYRLFARAYDTSEKWHGPRSRDSGESEFEHLYGCMLLLWHLEGVRDVGELCSMLLHDLVENFPDDWSFRRIAIEFNQAIADGVQGLSKRRKHKGETNYKVELEYYIWLSRFGSLRDVRKKGIDVLYNALTLWVRKPRRMRNKIRSLRKRFLPTLRKFPELANLRETIEAVWVEIERKID